MSMSVPGDYEHSPVEHIPVHRMAYLYLRQKANQFMLASGALPLCQKPGKHINGFHPM